MASKYLNPLTGHNLDEIQESSKRWHKAKLEGENPKDLAELIYRVMARREKTVYISKAGKTRHQCDGGRARSVEDVFRIALYYKSDVTLKEINKAVNILYGKSLYSHFCTTVRRHVHHPSNLSQNVGHFRSNLGKLNINF